MKTTVLIILSIVSTYFAISRAFVIWKDFQVRQEPTWKKVGFTVLAFIMGAIIWPFLLIYWGWKGLKNQKLLERVKNFFQQVNECKEYRGNRYLILVHSIITDKYYTYGYIMPWWWKNRLDKTCIDFYFDELNNGKSAFFKVITEDELKTNYTGLENFTSFPELMAEIMVSSVISKTSLSKRYNLA